MSYVPGICPECGLTISLETERKVQLCVYCGNPMETQEAIDKFTGSYQKITAVQAAITHTADELKTITKIRELGIPEFLRPEQSKTTEPQPAASAATAGANRSTSTVRVATNTDTGYQPLYRIREGVLVSVRDDLETVTIPLAADTIGDGCFEGKKKLKSVRFHDKVEYIGKNAFKGCTNLESAELPVRLKTIGDGAFENCTSLRETGKHYPGMLQSIGKEAFRNCSSLSEMRLPVTIYEVGENAFGGCRMLRINGKPAHTFLGIKG